jgi:hypothetical protein
VIVVTYTCERCTKQFDRRPKRKGYQFCSRKCANAGQIKVTTENLRPYAEKGARTKVIAAALGVEPHAICRALRRCDLHRTWSLRRFKKCAVAA